MNRFNDGKIILKKLFNCRKQKFNFLIVIIQRRSNCDNLRKIVQEFLQNFYGNFRGIISFPRNVEKKEERTLHLV